MVVESVLEVIEFYLVEGNFVCGNMCGYSLVFSCFSGVLVCKYFFDEFFILYNCVLKVF